MLLLLVTANDDDLPLSLENSIDESNIEVDVACWLLSCLVKASDDEVQAETAVLADADAADALNTG